MRKKKESETNFICKIPYIDCNEEKEYIYESYDNNQFSDFYIGNKKEDLKDPFLEKTYE